MVSLAMWAVVALLTPQAGTVESPPERYKSLETAIPEGIRLLEAKEYATFLNNFVEPEHFQKITKSRPLEEFARDFGEKKAAALLEVLKSIREAKPTLDSSETKATYALKSPVGTKREIVWVKVEDHWYIRN